MCLPIQAEPVGIGATPVGTLFLLRNHRRAGETPRFIEVFFVFVVVAFTAARWCRWSPGGQLLDTDFTILKPTHVSTRSRATVFFSFASR